MTEVLADQAAGLRRLLGHGRRRTVAIVSAAARSGRSVIAANLAVSLARQGSSVLLLDWGGGPKGVGWLLGVEPQADLLEAVRAGVPPVAACGSGHAGVRVVAAGRVAAALAGMSAPEEARLAHAVDALSSGADVVIVDGGPNDLPVCAAADELVLVTHPDTQSITETYRLLKRLAAVRDPGRARVLVNQVRITSQGARFFGNLSSTAAQFLGFRLELMGQIPYDERMKRATLLRQPVVEAFPDAPSSRILRGCAEAMPGWPVPGQESVAAFASRLVTVARGTGEQTTKAQLARLPQ